MKKEQNKNLKQGFTLLELLVVVLIIGILATVALPRYRKSVEKAKVVEALMNFKIIKESVERYILANGLPSENMFLEDLSLDVELSGGEWNDDKCYITKDYNYCVILQSSIYEIYAFHNKDLYGLSYIKNNNGAVSQICATYDTDIGENICHYLESQGWEYAEGEI